MTKRDPGKFEQRPRDYYPTIDPKAHKVIAPLIEGKTYAEPCAGAGDLIEGIGDLIVDLCWWASDITPDEENCNVGAIIEKDALTLDSNDLNGCDLIVTNPPFDKKLLLPLLDHFLTLKPTWLLLPADRMHVNYFAPYMEKCTAVHSVGRLCWFYKDGKRVAGVDNYAWFFWPQYGDSENPTKFYGPKLCKQ